MNNKLSKEEILTLIDEKGIKLSFLNSLIGGYRGKLTDWKKGKTSLTDEEINIILNYLLDKEVSTSTPSDEDIKFALFDGSEGVTDEMYDEVKRFAMYIKEKNAIKHKEKK